MPNSDPLDGHFYHNLSLMIESTMMIISPFNYLYAGQFFMCLLSSADFFKIIFFIKDFQEHNLCQTVWIQIMAHVLGPYLSPNCLQRLSEDNRVALARKELSTTVMLTL